MKKNYRSSGDPGRGLTSFYPLDKLCPIADSWRRDGVWRGGKRSGRRSSGTVGWARVMRVHGSWNWRRFAALLGQWRWRGIAMMVIDEGHVEAGITGAWTWSGTLL